MKSRKERLKKVGSVALLAGTFSLFYFFFFAGFASITIATTRQIDFYLIGLSEIQLFFTVIGLLLLTFFVPFVLADRLTDYLGFEKFLERNGWKIKRA